MSYNATTFHDRDRRLQGVFAAARDVTELKSFERTLQQKNAELEDASRMKSEFLANMSHELRTPLNAIIGFSEVLGDGLMGTMTEQQRGFVGDIFRAGKHLLLLINDILDLSKVEAGKMMLDLEPVQMSSLLANSLSIIKGQANSRQVKLEIVMPDGLGSVQADPRKLKQIVYNLLSNAVKFTPPKGQVTLSANVVSRGEVGATEGEGSERTFAVAESDFEKFLMISVQDSGIGIPPDALPQLFKPFFTGFDVRHHSSGQFEHGRKGIGLGLSVVKAFVGMHGGRISAESQPGQGTTFTLVLPRREGAKAEAST